MDSTVPHQTSTITPSTPAACSSLSWFSSPTLSCKTLSFVTTPNCQQQLSHLNGTQHLDMLIELMIYDLPGASHILVHNLQALLDLWKLYELVPAFYEQKF